jgi:hypothetical protein
MECDAVKACAQQQPCEHITTTSSCCCQHAWCVMFVDTETITQTLQTRCCLTILQERMLI